MSDSHSSDANFEEMLDALTDAVLEDDYRTMFEQQSDDDLKDYGALVTDLHTSLQEVHPSSHFTNRLKEDLIGMPEDASTWRRLLRLPPRVRVAAGIALLAGFMLVSRRRGSVGQVVGDEPEIAAM